MPSPLRGCVAVLVLAAAVPAAASPARPFGEERPEKAFAPAPAFHLADARLLARPLAGLEGDGQEPGGAPLAEKPPRRVLDGRTLRFTGAATLAALTIGYFTWWRDSRGGFRFANEKWFQADTYSGGADKASHVVFSWNAEWGLENAYRKLGHPDAEARWLALGLVTATGVLIEVGDGTSMYGASWEDAASNVIGGALSAGVSSLGMRDTFGMRFGLVKALIPDPCCRAGINYGTDYSRHIYTLDVKLAGLLPRVGIAKPGPARFLLLSLTYGSKGYRFSWEDRTERNVGLDVGLNLPEILRAAGVRDETWWGGPLLTIFSLVRIPYTTFGFHYDLNHRKWSGWDTGDRFDPGSVIYD